MMAMINPLDIPLVVDNVFKHLPSGVLESAGNRVSKLWKERAQKRLEKTVVVNFFDLDSINAYVAAFPGDDGIMHNNYALYGLLDFTNHIQQEVANMWNQIGSRMYSLEFGQECVTWEDLLPIFQQHTPNLKTLNFRELPTRQLDERGIRDEDKIFGVNHLKFSTLPIGIEDANARLLNAFLYLPRIRTITVPQAANVADKRWISSIFIQTLEHDQVHLNDLEDIGFPLYIQNESLTILLRHNFPLTKLTIILTETIQFTLLKKMLQSLSKTIIDLEIEFPEAPLSDSWILNTISTLQSFTNLKRLTITNGRGIATSTANLPSLEYLSLVNWMLPKTVYSTFFGTQSQFFRTISGSSLLQQLKLSFSNKIALEAELIYTISSLFPNIKRLSLSRATDSVLRVIFLLCPQLIELELNDSHVTDSGISGISREVIDTLSPLHDNKRVKGLRTDLSFISLPNLEKLTIVSSKITDVGIYFGLLELLETGANRLITFLKLASPFLTDNTVDLILFTPLCNVKILDMSDSPHVNPHHHRHVMKLLNINQFQFPETKSYLTEMEVQRFPALSPKASHSRNMRRQFISNKSMFSRTTNQQFPWFMQDHYPLQFNKHFSCLLEILAVFIVIGPDNLRPILQLPEANEHEILIWPAITRALNHFFHHYSYIFNNVFKNRNQLIIPPMQIPRVYLNELNFFGLLNANIYLWLTDVNNQNPDIFT